MALVSDKANEVGPDHLAQRLERLERKLDTLLAIERLSDQEWRSLDGGISKRNEAGGVRFGELTAALVESLERRGELARAAAARRQATMDAQALVELDACYDRLHAVAFDLAATPVSTLAQLRVKALAIRELVEEDSADIVHQLARSIAVDLARIDAAA